MKNLAIVSTHPIQYNAPWFRMLSERPGICLKVFYTWSQTREAVKDRTFGHEIKWDIPLLEGYDFQFVENVSKKPGSHHFYGIDNPALIKMIKTFNPDVILVFGWNFKSHFKVMRYFKGQVPVWFRGDSTLIDERPNFKTMMRRLVLKQVYKYVDKALYVGSANKEYFLAHGLKDSDLIYVPHAIDVDRFEDRLNENNYIEKAKNLRSELGLSDTPVVIFAGKFEEKKQPKQLMEAVVSINRNREKKVHLVLIGAGPMESELKSLGSEYDFISFLPFQNQTMMPVIYRLGDVFCLPSKGPGETWGLAVNESMACHTPVVVSNKVGCSRDLVDEGINGFIIEPNNSHSFILGLNKALNLEMDHKKSNFDHVNCKWHFKTIVQSIEKAILNK